MFIADKLVYGSENLHLKYQVCSLFQDHCRLPCDLEVPLRISQSAADSNVIDCRINVSR